MIQRLLHRLLEPWKPLRAFNQLDPSYKKIIFYAPDATSWHALRPIIVRLAHFYKRHVVYITHCQDDRALEVHNDRIHTFFLPHKRMLKHFIKKNKSPLFITTATDAWRYVTKGKDHGHCIYVYESVHCQQLLEDKRSLAFFDTVFCVGPHQAKQLREAEISYDISKTKLIRFGYSRMDEVINNVANDDHSTRDRTTRRKRHVLIAPCNIHNSQTQLIAIEAISMLLKAGFNVTFRPQNNQSKKVKHLLTQIDSTFSHESDFSIEHCDVASDVFYRADLMVTDWSPLALEFAFGIECPVLYINTPRPISNPEKNTAVHFTPLEETIRSLIGEVLMPEQIDRIPTLAHQMIRNRYRYIKSILEQRDRYVFNIGKSGLYGAKYIDNVLNQ